MFILAVSVHSQFAGSSEGEVLLIWRNSKVWFIHRDVSVAKDLNHRSTKRAGRREKGKMKDVIEQKIFLVFFISTSSRNCWCGLIYNKTITCLRCLFARGRRSGGRGSSASCLSVCFPWFSDGTFTKTIAESTKDHFQMAHASSAGCFSSTSFLAPLKATGFSRWKSASCTTLPLKMVGWTTTATT